MSSCMAPRRNWYRSSSWGGSYQPWSLRPTSTSVSLPNSEIATIDVDSTGRMWLATENGANINVHYSDAPYSSFSGPVMWPLVSPPMTSGSSRRFRTDRSGFSGRARTPACSVSRCIAMKLIRAFGPTDEQPASQSKYWTSASVWRMTT